MLAFLAWGTIALILAILALALSAQAAQPVASAPRAPRVPGGTQAQAVRACELAIAKHVGRLRLNETQEVYRRNLDALKELRVKCDKAFDAWEAADYPDDERRRRALELTQQVRDAERQIEVSQDDYFYCQERICNINALVG